MGLMPFVLVRSGLVDDAQLEETRENDFSRSVLAEFAGYDRADRIQRRLGLLLGQSTLLSAKASTNWVLFILFFAMSAP